MNRREFLIQTGAAVAWAALYGASARAATADGETVALLLDPRDPLTAASPVQWAVGLLRATLERRGFRVLVGANLADADDASLLIVAAGPTQHRDFVADMVFPVTRPESLIIRLSRHEGKDVLWAGGSDARGLMYALTEIADAVALAADPHAALRPVQTVVEEPANAVRSVMRLFASDIEDKGWFNDRDFWRGYFALLAANRFNRFNLALGLGYDQPIGLRDTYFYFAYPFLVDVPGYRVRATNLPDTERDSNLAMLRWISDEAAAHGLDFQLGLWTHAWRWVDSPNVNHVIEGLTPETHAPYCRDALTRVLEACPSITGVTLRIHGESGVPEGSYGLWRTIFDGCQRNGKRVPLDLHAKGMDQPTLDAAQACGSPLTISPKFWAEHMGLPYLPAEIRPTERPTGQPGRGPFTQSEGSRSFLRYGYGDLFRTDRRYEIVHRIWPGTQRVLLWGDPHMAAAYGRISSFGGAKGCEIFDPLSFKGRKGSGLPGGRDGYADTFLRAPGPDFEKYRLTHRLWGRLLYYPLYPVPWSEVWERQLRADYGPAAAAAARALAPASRILPLVTTAHCPSAANNNYWPEMYVNMAIADLTEAVEPYSDTPKPRRFGTVSPLDPQFFSTVAEFTAQALAGTPDARYSPLEVAQWLEALADESGKALAEVEAERLVRANAKIARLVNDVAIVNRLGRFFAAKLRAAVWFEAFQIKGDDSSLKSALAEYREAREHWLKVIEITSRVYVKDVSYGEGWFQRGNWSDRLPAIDRDIAAMARTTRGASVPTAVPEPSAPVSRWLTQPGARRTPKISNPRLKPFIPGQPVQLSFGLVSDAPVEVILRYRRMNQAERWRSLTVMPASGAYAVEIPAEYADGSYPLQFYLEFRAGTERPELFPGLGDDLMQMPYIIFSPTPEAKA